MHMQIVNEFDWSLLTSNHLTVVLNRRVPRSDFFFCTICLLLHAYLRLTLLSTTQLQSQLSCLWIIYVLKCSKQADTRQGRAYSYYIR